METGDKNQNPFPDIEIVPPLNRVFKAIGRAINMFPDCGYRGDHGAAGMLDAALDKPVQGTFDWAQPPFERQLGHEVMHGYLTAEDALRALETHDGIPRPDEV